jgi:hypothetical protein
MPCNFIVISSDELRIESRKRKEVNKNYKRNEMKKEKKKKKKNVIAKKK